MPSVISGYEYDIFISYRHNDNKSGWVTDFVNALQEELAATLKDPVTLYFDKNPHDGLLETHQVDKSLEEKLRCLIFIPIISQTYCDPKSYAWQHEFCAFNIRSQADQFGRDITLSNGNVASRILPVSIHDLDAEDKALIESEIGGVLRGIEFIYREPGVNRPLKRTDDRAANLNRFDYHNQLNKVALCIKEIVRRLTRQDAPVETAKSTPTAQEKIRTRSIVVLPFVNMSQDVEQEYFSDGLTEEIITDLSYIRNLHVISRSTAMTFKHGKKKISEVADELSVHYVLEGSVRKSENNIRITAQLIDAVNDIHLWAEKFDGTLADVFKIQEQVARSIAESLKVKLTQEEADKISNQPIKDTGAYDSYLRSRYEVQKWNEKSFDKALHYLSGALDVTGPNAFLYAGMAYVYFSYANFGIGANVNAALAEEFAAKAFELQPDLPEAHLVKGNILASFNGKIDEAIVHLKMALAGRTNDFETLLWLGAVSGILGLLEQRDFYLKTMSDLEPTNPMNSLLDGALHIYEGQFVPSESKLRKLSGPESPITNFFLVFDLILQHRHDEAKALTVELHRNNQGDSWSKFITLFGHALERDSVAFDQLLTAETRHWAWRDFQYSHFTAIAYSLLGDLEKTYEWLDHAITQGFVNYTFLRDHCPAMKLVSTKGQHDALLHGAKKRQAEFKVIFES